MIQRKGRGAHHSSARRSNLRQSRNSASMNLATSFCVLGTKQARDRIPSYYPWRVMRWIKIGQYSVGAMTVPMARRALSLADADLWRRRDRVPCFWTWRSRPRSLAACRHRRPRARSMTISRPRAMSGRGHSLPARACATSHSMLIPGKTIEPVFSTPTNTCRPVDRRHRQNGTQGHFRSIQHDFQHSPVAFNHLFFMSGHRLH